MTSVEGAVDAQEAGGVANVGQSILIYGLLKYDGATYSCGL